MCKRNFQARFFIKRHKEFQLVGTVCVENDFEPIITGNEISAVRMTRPKHLQRHGSEESVWGSNEARVVGDW